MDSINVPLSDLSRQRSRTGEHKKVPPHLPCCLLRLQSHGSLKGTLLSSGFAKNQLWSCPRTANLRHGKCPAGTLVTREWARLCGGGCREGSIFDLPANRSNNLTPPH
ncbi:hypothetical protein BaRGS_00039901 [Batillaria attramentaria]|uniref:Uncharacterized protein n=1 Tax=Batillaria attramentaria TaxID=370345 RepID=A0ABD0J1S7_9CAEN